MNLRDNIKIEIENGNLPEIFTTQQTCDLRRTGDYCYVNNVRYTISTIRTTLPNHSIGPGDRKGEAVKKGNEILFAKHSSRATYSIIDDFDEDDEDEQKNSPLPEYSGSGLSNKEKIATAFVDYLRNKPFRIRQNKNGAWLPNEGPALGWQERLDAYVWNGRSWEETSNVIASFVHQLETLKSRHDEKMPQNLESEAKKIYLAIRKWGNPKGTVRDGSFIMERLVELWSGIPTAVDSTLTKLYAFAKPDDYIIYDSRVAAAILTIAEDIYRYRTIEMKRIETVNLNFHSAYPHLGTYPGAGGTRPRAYRWSNWPNAYCIINAQIDANDLCKRIVNVLNNLKESERENWTMREVEAVFFMEGY